MATLNKVRILSGPQKAKIARLAPEMAHAIQMQQDYESACIHVAGGKEQMAIAILKHYGVTSIEQLSRATWAIRQAVLKKLSLVIR